MPWFVKVERFTKDTLSLTPEKRRYYLSQHCQWVDKINASGKRILSGYLIDEKRCPGGGGVMVIEAKNYQSAKEIVKQDPMIIAKLVTWELSEWIPVSGKLDGFQN